MPQREQKAQHSLLIAFMFCLAAGPCLVNPHCTPRAPTPLLSRATENNLMEAASYYCQTGAQSAIDLKEKVFQWLLGLGWCPSSPSLLLKQWILPAGYPLTFLHTHGDNTVGIVLSSLRLQGPSQSSCLCSAQHLLFAGRVLLACRWRCPR